VTAPVETPATQQRHCVAQLFVDLEDDRARTVEGKPMKLPRVPLPFDGLGAKPGPVPRLGADNDEFRHAHSTEEATPA
jgi:CoA:oxalate CoA-transferase